MQHNFDFQEEETILIEKATRRKEEEILKKINKERAYLLRKSILENYFIRMSSINKERLIKKLFTNFVDIGNVLELANFLSLGDAKPFVYTKVYHHTNFKHDICIVDHNRCLAEAELKEAIENDIGWFKTLESDHQLDVIISLIKHSGGHIQKNLFFPILKKCLHKKKSDIDVDTEIDNYADRNKERYSESRENMNYYDHPATIDVEVQRRNWNQIISKYRDKVQGVKAANLKEKGGKTKTKGGKEAKSKESSQTDWIQLLPVWDVKKIFSYLDQKTLQKVKKVNGYWSYVAQEVIKEKKMRIQLRKEIEKLKSEISPEVLTNALEMEQLRQPEVIEVKRRRRMSNYHRGAILKKLVPKQTEGLVNTSLIADVTKEVTEDFFTENIVSFPRDCTDETKMYKFQPCFLRDVNVVLGDQEDIKAHKSFMTYSLSTPSATLSLPVDRQTLDEW